MFIRKLIWLSHEIRANDKSNAAIYIGLALTDIKSTPWNINYSKENLLNDSIKFMH